MIKKLKVYVYLFLITSLFSSTYEVIITLDDYNGLFQGSKVISDQQQIGKVRYISEDNQNKWSITLKIYSEYKDISDDMLFKIENSSLVVDYEGMELREQQKEEERLAKIRAEKEAQAAEEARIAAAEQARIAAEEEERLAKIRAEKEAQAAEEARIAAEEKERLAKIRAEAEAQAAELARMATEEEERLAKIRAEKEAQAAEEVRIAAEEEERLAKIRAEKEAKAAEQARIAAEEENKIENMRHNIRHFYFYVGTHNFEFENETFKNNLGNLLDIRFPITYGFTGNVYDRFPLNFKYDFNYSKTPYDLLGSISFDIIEEDDTQFDTDEDGVVIFDQNDNVDFNLSNINSSISFDLFPNFFIRPFLGIGYSYSILNFHASRSNIDEANEINFQREQTFGSLFIISNLIYEWKGLAKVSSGFAGNIYFDLSYRLSLIEKELKWNDVQFNIGFGI